MQRRKFSREFKFKAVKLVRERSLSVTMALGLPWRFIIFLSRPANHPLAKFEAP